MSQKRFDESTALKKLKPFVDYAKSLGNGLGELEVADFLIILARAISSDCKYDTRDLATGDLIRERFAAYIEAASELSRQAIKDLERSEDIRRAEVIEKLTPYQQQILGFNNTRDQHSDN